MGHSIDPAVREQQQRQQAATQTSSLPQLVRAAEQQLQDLQQTLDQMKEFGS